jgi:N6-adenosine-specific RNA methylase IME4
MARNAQHNFKTRKQNMIKIDPELKALIPPLAPEEYAQLEANLIADGCRDPLVVWAVPPDDWWTEEGILLSADLISDEEIKTKKAAANQFVEILHRTPKFVYLRTTCKEEGVSVEGWIFGVRTKDALSPYETSSDAGEGSFILIDGHNRREICAKHNIPFETVPKFFQDRDAVMDWMDANQLGRRNISPDTFRLLLGRIHNRRKLKSGTRTDLVANCDKVDTAGQLAKEYGVHRATVIRAGKFAEEVAAKPELQKAIDERKPVLQVKREIKESNRESRRQENRAKVAEVEKPADIVRVGAKFATIVIDPPWDWGDEGDQDQLGRARPDYATMSIDELCALPVGDLADVDCHLYLWITNRSLPKGFRLMDAWGFRYITAITWAKPHFGMGNYFRGQTEHILFGVKGSQPLMRKDVGTIFTAPRGPNGHSSKPAEFYELVESCSPGPHLEMFSRCDREGWKTWGQES